VYHPSTKSINLVEPTGAGLTNTIGRAELAAIAAAVTHDHNCIGTDSLDSIHQIRKQLLYPEKHRHHVQKDLLKKITNLIRNSETHISLYKVKAHAGLVGNECADAIAKHQAIQTGNNSADTTIPNEGIDGNPFFEITWLASENPNTPAANSTRPYPPTLKLNYLANLRDALKNHMHTTHKLGYANSKTGYYSFYQSLLPIVSKSISNAFWTMSNISFKMKQNIFNYRSGTLFNQKHAVRFKKSTSLQCPLCQQTDSALHILSGCQHSIISNMITERHNIACRLIMKAISKASFKACIVSLDIGSKDRLAQQNLQIPESATSRIPPKWLFPPRFPDRNRLTCSRPDAILVTAKTVKTTPSLPRQVPQNVRRSGRARGPAPPVKCRRPCEPHELPKERRHIHLVEIKYCEDTRPSNQLQASEQQHSALKKQLQGGCVTLHTILLGVGGTIYVPHTLSHFTNLGLDSQRAIKLAHKLHAHSVTYAHKLTSTRRAIENNNNSQSQGLGMNAARHPPDPH